MTGSKLVAPLSGLPHGHTLAHTRGLTLAYNLLLISNFGLVIDFLRVFGLNYSEVHFISSPSPLPGPSLPPPFPSDAISHLATLVNKWVKFGFGLMGVCVWGGGVMGGCEYDPYDDKSSLKGGSWTLGRLFSF